MNSPYSDFVKESIQSGTCLQCGASLGGNMLAYISGGAVEDADCPHQSLTSYLSIGLHPNPDSNAVDICVLDDWNGGQFQLSFCSFRCLQQWFLVIISRLESEYERNVSTDE
jgi:hypothetical protein